MYSTECMYSVTEGFMCIEELALYSNCTAINACENSKRDNKCWTCCENNLGLLTYWTPQSCFYTFFNNENKNDNDNQPPKCSETRNKC